MKLRDELSIRPIFPSKMMGHLPVDYHSVKRSFVTGFGKALKAAEEARSEKPMQQFIERYPVVLVSIVSPHRVGFSLARCLETLSEEGGNLISWYAIGPVTDLSGQSLNWKAPRRGQ